MADHAHGAACLAASSVVWKFSANPTAASCRRKSCHLLGYSARGSPVLSAHTLADSWALREILGRKGRSAGLGSRRGAGVDDLLCVSITRIDVSSHKEAAGRCGSFTPRLEPPGYTFGVLGLRALGAAAGLPSAGTLGVLAALGAAGFRADAFAATGSAARSAVVGTAARFGGAFVTGGAPI